MRPIPAHAALLVVALGTAWWSWSSGFETPPGPGSVAIWEGEPDDVSALRFESEATRVVLERRGDEAGPYLWATVTPSTPPADPAGDSSAAAAPPLLPGSTPSAFVVGESGEDLVRAFAAPRALRELGTVGGEREREYGLDRPKSRVRVEVGGASRELLVGDPVFASGDRYVKDVAGGRAYVVPSTLLISLESPESLTERRLHAFAADAVGAVVVRAAGSERRMRRLPATEAGIAWAPAEGSDRADETFTTFMDRVEQLWAEAYAPDVDRASLRELLRIDYQDERGEPLGWLSLLQGGAGDYYVATEHTRVPVRSYAGAAESLARDVEQIFGEAVAQAAPVRGD